jgi:MFS family permease
MGAEIREGWGVVLENRLLRSIAGCTGTANFFAAAFFSLYILYATRHLGLTPAHLGLIFTVGNLTGLIGALSAGRLGVGLGVGRTILGSAAVMGLGYIPVVLATPATAVPLLVLSAMVESLAGTIYNISQVSLRQAITPLHLQGRMNATMRFLVWGTMPVGGLIGGAVGDVLGLRGAVLLLAGGGLTAFLWIAFSPVPTLRAIPEPV